ncbi:MAG: SDR family oxidoreductase [Firmicutes bacterium]|nr:SDR family oxidoreductase [Bacillota bacterium]
MYNVKNKVVVITGAGGVLCGAFAKECAKYGAKVALLDLNLEAARARADEITANGGFAKAYRADVLDKERLERVRAEIRNDLGLCDILINGAGGNSPKATTDKESYSDGGLENEKSFFGLDKSGFSSVFDLNILGAVIPSQVFIRDMLGRKGCSVLNISSMNAFKPLTKIPAYSAAKSAVSNFTQWLAVHFAKEGIRVNAVAPGFFATRQNAALLYNDDGTPTPRTGKILAATPMGRLGRDEELLGALMFLLDETKSGFITGVILPVDGGFSAYSGV